MTFWPRITTDSGVLIESDWNLKGHPEDLETVALGINRIRLEFKAAQGDAGLQAKEVLIESDWNLRII